MARTPEQIEELLDKVESLVNAYSEADAAYQDKQDADNWNAKYGERLGQYSDKAKLLNGDDFDIIESSRKEYKDSYPDLSDDDYVNSLEENLKKIFARVWPEAPVEEVENAVEEAVTETESETEAESETETESETEEESSDPNADFVAELETYKAAMPKRNKKEEEDTSEE